MFRPSFGIPQPGLVSPLIINETFTGLQFDPSLMTLCLKITNTMYIHTNFIANGLVFFVLFFKEETVTRK